MSGTFSLCTNLQTAPDIPNSVTDIGGLFEGCTGLRTAPVIPSGVTILNRVFYECTNLETAPEIPSSVTEMQYTFYGCTKLTGNLVLNTSNITYYTNCLTDAAMASGCDLKITGSASSTIKNNILNTKSEGSHISIQ